MRPIIGIATQIDDKTANPYSEARYVNFVRDAGGTPVILLPGYSLEETEDLVSRVDAVIIPGGDDISPSLYGQERLSCTGISKAERDLWEPWLVEATLKANKPLLGICKGSQMIQVALGGQLVQDIPTAHPGNTIHVQTEPPEVAVHAVTIFDNTPLGGYLQEQDLPLNFAVNSYHHQTVVEPLASRVSLMGRAKDGIIEAIYVPEARFAWGVQWHPEMMPQDVYSQAIGKALIAAAREGKKA